MIKANELRIGNVIEFCNFIQPKRLVTIDARFFCSLAAGRSMSEMKPNEEINNYYTPIPLTPEILDKCGFEKRQCNYSTIKSFCYYKTEDDHSNFIQFGDNECEYCIEMFAYGHDGYVAVKLEYFHQLQNLYFALTGEELEVNLNSPATTHNQN